MKKSVILLFFLSSSFASNVFASTNTQANSNLIKFGKLGNIIHTSGDALVPGTNAALFKLVNGGGFPSTNFDFTGITIGYFQIYTSSSSCGTSQASTTITGSIPNITLPKSFGLDATSAATIYENQTFQQPTNIHCISIEATGTDSNTNDHTSDTKFFQVDCSSGTQCIAESSELNLTFS